MYIHVSSVCVCVCVCVCVYVPVLMSYGLIMVVSSFFVLCVGATGSSKWQLFGRKGGFSLSKGLKAILDESSHGPIEVAGVYGHVFSHFRSFEKDVSCSD